MKQWKWILSSLVLVSLITLAACGSDNEESADEESEQESGEEEMDHSDMDHSGSGEVPEGLEEAEAPTFEEGDKAVITASHMEGMDGAEATIAGAYSTIAYVISYEPTDGGERVEDHKWIVHEEVEDAGDEPFESGDEVTINASHMEGMERAAGEIESAEETTVYMVDFTPADGGEEVKNHKWVTESELEEME
ncbi:YdhK family protein [Halobacillus sp. A5]|uniref:YdhK family protein n=1 Tax=Halobacillus sp. A5 TaxID=2880263 RepID=UPI0020A68CC9|nr:YdhK family protein [Halobacillus sp. A5]MCP3027933.1 YdhK family protein [Halobacillus sp. A5]